MIKQFNAAGKRVQELYKKRWKTNTTYELAAKSTQSKVFRAFHGTYNISLVYDGVLKESQDVNLIKGSTLSVKFVLK